MKNTIQSHLQHYITNSLFFLCAFSSSGHLTGMDLPPKKGRHLKSPVTKFQKKALPEKVKRAIAAQKVNRQDKNGCTLLHCAAELGCKDMVTALLDAGADIEATTSLHIFTPLRDAVRNNHLNVVRLLLDRGALMIRPGECWNPLHNAYGSDEAVVKLLLDRNADIDAGIEKRDPPIRSALVHGEHTGGDYRVAQLLIRSGARATLNQIISAHLSPLNQAAALGLVQIVADLQHGSSPDALQEALAYAVGQRQQAVVNLLLLRTHPKEALVQVQTILKRLYLTPEDRACYERIQESLLRPAPLSEQIIRCPEVHTHLIDGIDRLPAELRDRILSQQFFGQSKY